MTNVSRMNNPIDPNFLVPMNNGMYEPHCTSNCAIGSHIMPPIWDLLLAKMALDRFLAHNCGFPL